MTKSMSHWIFQRRLLLGAIVGIFVLSNAALSQASSTSGGPKFQKAGERNGVFKPARPRDECEFVSHNLRFCAAGTDWVQEREPVHGEQALYQLSNGRRASFTVIPMKEDASRKLASTEVAELLDQHIFSDGPRGTMEVEAIVEDEKTPSGRLLHRRAFVRDNAGLLHLLQVSVLTLDYGLGFLETTIAVPAAGGTLKISEEDIAFHQEFLKIGRVSISVHR